MTREEINDVNDDDINTMRILFNALINDLCNQCRHNDAEEMEGIRDRLIKRLLEQEPEWIPVSERVPEENGEYLVTVKRGYVMTALWVEDAENWKKVTAWMPLPTPYKAESEVDS